MQDAACGKCKSIIPKGAECVGCDYCSEWFHRAASVMSLKRCQVSSLIKHQQKPHWNEVACVVNFW